MTGMAVCSPSAGTILEQGDNVVITGSGTALDPYVISAGAFDLPASWLWQGPWGALTAYLPNDVVQDGGSSWISLLPGIGHVPSVSPLYWALVAQKGATGAAGAAGAAGPAGGAGPTGATGALGPVGPTGNFATTYRGAWSAGLDFAAGDIVRNAGSSWLALAPSTHAAPVTPVEGATWTQIAAAGADGSQYVARGENTSGVSASTTTLVDVPGTTVSWVTDGGPYELCIDAHLVSGLGTASSPNLVGCTVQCVDIDNANAEVFRTAIRGYVQTTQNSLFAPSAKKFVVTYAAGLTKNFKLMVQLGTSGLAAPSGATATLSAGATFPAFLGVKHA